MTLTREYEAYKYIQMTLTGEYGASMYTNASIG